MNRLNLKLRDVLTRYQKCKKNYYNSQNIKTEFSYHVATKIAHEWCAIAESIRKGYKKVKE